MVGFVKSSAVLAAAVAVSGCITPERTSFMASANQQTITRDGFPALVSRKANSVVLVSTPSRQQEHSARTVMVIGITDVSKQPVDFKVENVTVEQLKDGAATNGLPVVTYEQLVSEEKTRQVFAALAIGLAAGANAYGASHAGYGYGTANVYTPSGRTYTVSGTYYNPASAAIAQANASAQNDAMIGQTIEAGQRNLSNLENGVIKDNTLMPGEWYGGQLHFTSPIVEGSEPKSFRLTIPVGNDVHVVDVIQQRVKG